MRRFILAATAIAAVAVSSIALIAPSMASAAVQAPKVGTLVSTANTTTPVHTYAVEVDNGHFAGIGGFTYQGKTTIESISGTVSGSNVTSFTAKYLAGPWAGYSWTYSGGTSASDSWGSSFSVVSNVLHLI